MIEEPKTCSDIDEYVEKTSGFVCFYFVKVIFELQAMEIPNFLSSPSHVVYWLYFHVPLQGRLPYFEAESMSSKSEQGLLAKGLSVCYSSVTGILPCHAQISEDLSSFQKKCGQVPIVLLTVLLQDGNPLLGT